MEQPTEKPSATTAKKESSFSRHSVSVAAVAFSPNGKRLASAGGDRVKVTDLETGKEILKLKNSRGMEFLSVVYAPDGRWIAASQSKLKDRKTRRQGEYTITTLFYVGETIIWDAQTGAVIATINDDNAPCWRLALSPDGRTLAIGSGPTVPKEKNCQQEVCEGFGEVLLVNTNDWKIRTRLRGKAQPVRVLAFSPDGKWLAASSGRSDGPSSRDGKEEYEALIWNVETGALQERVLRHSGPIMALAFSPDGKWLASSGRDRSLKIWNAQTFQLARTASEFMISAEEIESITDSAGRKKAKDALPRISWLSALAFAPDSKTVIGCGADAILRFYQTDTGKISHVLKPRDWPIVPWNVFWGMGGPPMFGSGLPQPPMVGRIEVPMRPPPSMGLGRGGALNSMALSRDGKTLAIGGADGKLRVMNLN
ncbi:MAG: hypothetical protein U0Y68_26400 [Blastocatellia bacterium]